jgi:hypothetical protein
MSYIIILKKCLAVNRKEERTSDLLTVDWPCDYLNGCKDPLRWPSGTLCLQNLALTWLISGRRAVGIVRSLTQVTEISFSSEMLRRTSFASRSISWLLQIHSQQFCGKECCLTSHPNWTFQSSIQRTTNPLVKERGFHSSFQQRAKNNGYVEGRESGQWENEEGTRNGKK